MLNDTSDFSATEVATGFPTGVTKLVGTSNFTFGNVSLTYAKTSTGTLTVSP
jgi:hypothetical protein